MKKYLFLLAAAPLTIFLACNRMDAPAPEGGGEAYLDLPDSVYQYFPGPNSPENEAANNLATLGRVLFYERQLSLNNSVSCGSCHKQVYAFADNTAGSVGFENKITGRNTPALQNFGFSGFMLEPNAAGGPKFVGDGSLFWDGRERNMQKLVSRPISNHVEMGMTDLDVMAEKVRALSYYKPLFEKAFGTDEINVERISTAIAIFVTSIKAENTRFDQSERMGTAKLSALEEQGMFLFNQKYNCQNCHNENLFGYFSGNFRNIGLDAPYSDLGMGVISGNSEDNGRFKVPNLRNVTLTAPYMHDGRFKTLDEVLEHYSHGIKADANLDTVLKDPATGGPMRMNITAHEKEAIIAFLGALTDYDMITNPAYSDPFKIK